MNKMNIESSTACNAKCVFCPRYEMTRPMGEMSDELFHKIIKEGKEMGIKFVSPFMNGEPFVFPRIWEWLDFMEKEGMKFSLYTNAEFLDVDRLIKYKNVWYVNCSVNAATKETYDKVMRGPNYDVVMRNIHELYEKAKFLVRTSFVVTEENQHELELFKAMHPEPFKRMKIYGMANWTGDRRNSVERKGKKIPCWTLFNQISILWDGKVVPCCMDYDAKMVMGDANKQSLKEILENNEWMREKHRKGEWNDIPVCKNCNYNCYDRHYNNLSHS